MAIKFVIQKLEDVAENLRPLYKQDGNVFVLDAEGAVPKERLDEFRNNNISLQQQLDKLKDVDPVKYAELIKLDNEVKEGKLIKEGKLEEVVNLRVSTMKRDLEGQVNNLNTVLSKTKSQLHFLLIDNVIKTHAIKLGAIPDAIDDIVLRARGVYSVDDNGVPVPKNEKGEVIYGKNGKDPMPVDEWLSGLKGSAKHLFMGSQGGGAGGGRGQPTGNVGNLTPVQKISMGLAQGGLLGALPTEQAGQ